MLTEFIDNTLFKMKRRDINCRTHGKGQVI